MAVQTKNQSITSVVGKNGGPVLPNGHQPGFQVPFSERRMLLMLGDSTLLFLSVMGAFLLWRPTAHPHLDLVAWIKEYGYWIPLLIGSWWTLAWLNDLFDVPSSLDGVSSTIRSTVVSIVHLTLSLPIIYFLPNRLPGNFFFYFLAIAWASITTWRLGYAALLSRFSHRILIVGQGKRGQSIAQALGQGSKLNYQVLGYVDENLTRPRIASDGLPILGAPSELPGLVRQFQIHEVVLAIEHQLNPNLFEYLVDCQANGVQVSLMFDLYEKLHRKTPVQHIDPDWVMQAMQGRPIFSRLELGLKRLIDLVLVISALPALALTFPLIALAVRLDSAGPIFYRQVRSGRGGKPFQIIKFRTMITDAEKDGKPRWATKNDPRITRIGHFLRKTRLDELPQIFNVLQGDMSIVGPRPERPEFIAELQREIPFYRTRLMIKPGLTGWAQIHYTYGNSIQDALIKLQYDLYYLRHWSIWLDIYIIFRTIGVMLRFKGN